MDTYWIRYISGERGIKVVKADRVVGQEASHDVFVFSRNGKVVALVPKAKVASIELMEGEEE